MKPLLVSLFIATAPLGMLIAAGNPASIFLQPLVEQADAKPSRILNERPFQARQAVAALAWSSAANALFAELEDEHRTLVFDAATGKLQHESQLQKFALSNDGKWIAGFLPLGDEAAEMELVVADAKSGKITWRKNIPKEHGDIRFSPNDRQLAFAATPKNRPTLVILDSRTGRQLASWNLEGNAGQALQHGLAFLSEKLVLLSDWQTHQPVVIDLGSGADVTADNPFGDWKGIQSFAPTNLPAAANRVMKTDKSGWGLGVSFAIWGFGIGESPKILAQGSVDDFANFFHGACFTADGRVAVVLRGAECEVFDLEGGGQFGKIPGGATLGAISTDNTSVAVACGAGIRTSAIDKKSLARNDMQRGGYSTGQFDLQPNGMLLAASDGDRLKMWDISTGKEVQPPALPEGCSRLCGFRFHPNGQDFFVTNSTRVWVCALDKDKGPPVSVLHWDDEDDHDMRLHFSPDGREIATQRDGKSWFYRPDKSYRVLGGKFRKIAGIGEFAQSDWVETFAYSEDGSRYAVCDLTDLQTYESSSDKLISSVKIDSDDVLGLSGDLQRALIKKSEQTDAVVVIDPATGESKLTLPWDLLDKRYGAVTPTEATFDKSGHYLVVAFENPTKPAYGLALFDSSSGRLLKSVKTQRGAIEHMLMNTKEATLAVLNGDSSIQLFPLQDWISSSEHP